MPPVFAFLAFTSGSYEGAIIRDMRLANDLHRRGFTVFVYWMMETNRELVDRGIRQRILCRNTRYQTRSPSGLLDCAGKILAIYPAQRRRRFAQQHPDYVGRLMCNFVRTVCDGDRGLENRLERFLLRDGATHVLPTFAMTCPFVQAVKERGRHKFDYLATFQGEEIFANYAQQIGRLEDYYARLRKTVAGSAWPAIAVSNDYIARLRDEMGIDASKLTAIYPGIALPAATDGKPAFETLLTKIPGLRPDVPIVTYFGRQDSEKGIDLLLYAVKILAERGLKMQLVACGGSSFGLKYREVCEQIAHHLRVKVMWKRRVSEEIKAALYAHSRCVVYPSIHREPFGMVAAEAMSQGTPVLVPDQGGVKEAVRWNGAVGGLTFKAWDTADLARQLERLLTDDALHAELAAQSRAVASNFSVEKMTDGVLGHLGIEREREK
ncbi:MAG TPA: glycosyltransferase family 4 protein [Tepidisphaeraceae bacterium]|nr:glycosyltransferase family 4 protein [Tepidisphaeraceae bacterium]